ncbi:cysteine proteinase [Phellopilus nigrolimitatus]|nr:cysteine proteinase [Phellopilus nigrolimitatus]
MFSALRALFVHISNNALDKGTVSPKAFVEKLKKENELFRSSMHQDAHEFLIYLLNKIAEDLEEEARNTRSGSSSGEDLSNSVTSSGPSTFGTVLSGTNSMARSTLVHDLFEGVLTSETRCLTCETVSSRDEAFLDLSIDIEQNSSVTACLRQFSASEMLCQKNKFFCDSCCGLQEAEKRMKIKRLPNILALHLKRFKYQEDVGKYIKLTYRVAFPLELRLFNTVDDAQDPDRLYELFAIVVHIGNGPHHGHYVAIVKSKGSWVVFDDDSVDIIKESDIPKYFGDSNSGCAYVLYYQAVDLDLVALGLKSNDPPLTESVAESYPVQTPALPPGLTHEGDSDASELAPTTPGSPATAIIPTIVPHLSPHLTVTIPLPESDSAAPIPVHASTPTVSSPNGKPSGFFSSLRHSPSKSHIGSGNRTSIITASSPPVPPLPPSSFMSPKLSSEPSEASTSTASAVPTIDSKVKTPKEKSSGWFARRRSVRPEKKNSSDTPSRPATAHEMRDHHDGASFTSSSASSRAPDTSPSLRASASTSEAPPLSMLSTSPKSPQITSPTAHSPNVPQDELLTFSRSPPPSYPRHHFPGHLQSPGHKKSQPSLSGSPKTKLPSVRSPKRPSTAEAVISSPNFGSFARLDEGVPVPPLPSDLRSPLSRPRNTDHPHTDPLEAKEDREWRRFSTGIPPPAPVKRPPRKLSLTGGMLSFGRKDKDKQKDREPPGTMLPAGAGSPSMLPSLSAVGRM